VVFLVTTGKVNKITGKVNKIRRKDAKFYSARSKKAWRSRKRMQAARANNKEVQAT
jgi:hypothetical protein